MKKLRIGTRASKLALWQTNFVADELRKNFPQLEIEIIHITTKGDKILDTPLSKIGGKGLFTKELELQMLNHKIDLAVHSLKDVPVQLSTEFTIAAVTKRFDPFDVLVSNKYHSIEELPKNSIVGTSSLRRRAQILAIRPDLQVVDLRGNVDTRLKKLDAGNFDAIILAAAGLKRLNHGNRINEVLLPNIMLPAVGQGALAIETLTDNIEVCNLLKFLDDADTRAATSAERAFLKVVEGGCQVPVGVFAEVLNNEMTVEALIASIDGQKVVNGKIAGRINFAESLGEMLANNLLDSGGREILGELI